MKTPYIATLSFLAASLFMSTAVHANEVTGVKCPAGSTATISNGSKKLVCKKPKEIILRTACAGQMDTLGQDMCLPLVSGERTPAGKFGYIPGVMPPENQFILDINPTRQDRWIYRGFEYVYPEGATLPYVGDASTGVSCPSGYDGDTAHGGKGIRCDKIERNSVTADCDIVLTYDRDDRGNEDRCKGFSQNLPTKPRGMTGAQFELEQALSWVKWHLNVRAGNDTWKKKVYAFPRAH